MKPFASSHTPASLVALGWKETETLGRTRALSTQSTSVTTAPRTAGKGRTRADQPLACRPNEVEMLSEMEIWQSAAAMIKRYGKDAGSEFRKTRPRTLGHR